ncbi:hypothetical protein DPMN_159843 [Dreissena polymorpha]|uniref:Uncharacterized protein n=1 Tax=Dreissena polymorpha TaxID=45954 RepID=A0A9D4EM62_DREPO|nr:hypothetical protein DPMN_159843 [Dreissena polymorpha]
MCPTEAWHFQKVQPWQFGCHSGQHSVHRGRILVKCMQNARRNRASRKHVPASRQNPHKHDARTENNFDLY